MTKSFWGDSSFYFYESTKEAAEILKESGGKLTLRKTRKVEFYLIKDDALDCFKKRFQRFG